MSPAYRLILLLVFLTAVCSGGRAQSLPDIIHEISNSPALLNLSPVVPPEMVALADTQLRLLVEHDLAACGSMSVGFPKGGALVNAVPMPESPHWEIINPNESWGTEETVAFIGTVIHVVNRLFPDSPPLYIGDISHRDGGRLNRHYSHQAGRDADLGFYYKGGKGTWHAAGHSRNLDLARNWALVRALIVHTDVEVILLDRRIQKLLYDHARSIGEDPDWLRTVFEYPAGRGPCLVRHDRGHRTHYHVRFFNRRAQELGIKAYRHLLELKKIQPPVYYQMHRVRSGQTLGHLARRYGTSIRAIQRANNLGGTLIRAGRTYRIPIRSGVDSVPARMEVPPRNLPPTLPEIMAVIDWTPAPHPVSPLQAHRLPPLLADLLLGWSWRLGL
ncbi:MAG: penicillin-insensitive murein endopeptidase [Acidobacteria bacterium]|nr:penicillin-insensitive murein endopeptidase [Acidobacteriota bacterium]